MEHTTEFLKSTYFLDECGSGGGFGGLGSSHTKAEECNTEGYTVQPTEDPTEKAVRGSDLVHEMDSSEFVMNQA